MSVSIPGLAEEPPRPVARVAVDIPLAHLDRLFDYEVPQELAERVRPGVRVRVRFAGRQCDGWVVELGRAEPGMKLSRVEKVVSDEEVLTAVTYRLIRQVADHYAGTFSDVARLAIPPRHATTEKANQRHWPAPAVEDATYQVLPRFPTGEGYLAALARGDSPRAFWQVPAVAEGVGDLHGGVVEAVVATIRSGRTAVVIVPTARELEHARKRLGDVLGPASVATLSADSGRSARYRNYLAVLRGEARVVVGTRSAAFAPLTDLGLVVVVDDGHDAHIEQRAPYPHSRSIAVLRSLTEGCAVLFASHARSTEAHSLVVRGWLHQIALAPAEVRKVTPPVRIVGDDVAREPVAARLRLPSAAFRFLRERLVTGPVLVQVPRAGHSAGLVCGRCGERARCPRCTAPLRRPSRDEVACPMCGYHPPRWECPHCHASALRAPIAGARRTAEELARAFPGVIAVNSSAERIRTSVPAEPAIVVATPGAEPWCPGGYSGVLLLDTELMLARPDLRVVEESARRWIAAAALCRGPREGGTVVAVGPTGEPALQALVRGDIASLVDRELAERTRAGLPPAVKAVRVGGDAAAVAEFLDNDEFPDVDILGPAEVRSDPDPEVAALLRVPLDRGKDLVTRVKHATAIRSARKEPGRLYVQVDPEVME